MELFDETERRAKAATAMLSESRATALCLETLPSSSSSSAARQLYSTSIFRSLHAKELDAHTSSNYEQFPWRHDSSFDSSSSSLDEPPVWMLHSGYQPPNGGLYVTNPRTINDILFRSLVIRACAIYAHVHLLDLLAGSSRYDKVLFAVASTAYPELILVQLAYNAVATMALVCQRASPPANVDVRRYYLATLIGASLSSSSTTTLGWADADASDVVEHVRPRPRLPWSFFIWALNLMPLLVALVGYRQRLGINYHVATYVGNLGVDHGNAWAAISGITASAMSAVAMLLNATWSPNSNSNSSSSSSSSDGSAELDHETRKDGGHVDPARWQHAVYVRLLAQTVVAALIHHVPLVATNHFALFVHIWRDARTPSLCLSWALLWYLHGRTFRKGYHLRRYALEVGLLLVLAPAIIQMVSDGNELVNVAHFQVERYNYRWAVKDVASARRRAKCLSLATQPCTEGGTWYYGTS